MDYWIKNIIQRLQTCSELLDFKAALVDMREQLGFAHFLYGVRVSTAFTSINHFVVSDYPEAWLGEYMSKNYAEFDPVVQHCTSRHEPYCWDRIRSENSDPRVLAFADAHESHGLVGGVCIGIHGYSGENGIFCVGGPRPLATGSDEAFAAIVPLNTLLPYIHAALGRLTTFKEAENNKPQLSERELECLLWSAEGKTAEETALILDISTPTVNFHLKNAIQKLNVSNRNQAIAKAALMGIITPQYSTLSAPRTYLF
jgi:DNA-binding CsgD family transcriptional regulator